MIFEVHILTNDADWILPWTLRHYSSYGARIFVHDGGPAWGPESTTLELCKLHGATHVVWDTAGQLNDDLARRLKNECWKGTDADFVAVVDCDELVYFPAGVKDTLGAYKRCGAAVVRCIGFEMYSDYMPEAGGQIYDEIKMGAPENKWYSKPILFNPSLLSESGLGIGAHEARPVLKDGRSFFVGPAWTTPNPPTYLLHFHQIGTLEQVANRYDATRKRLSGLNVARRWGNFETGIVHAQQKRDLILPSLRQVVY